MCAKSACSNRAGMCEPRAGTRKVGDENGSPSASSRPPDTCVHHMHSLLPNSGPKQDVAGAGRWLLKDLRQGCSFERPWGSNRRSFVNVAVRGSRRWSGMPVSKV